MANEPVAIHCDKCGKAIEIDDEQEIPDWLHPDPDAPYEQIVLCQTCLYGRIPADSCPDCKHPAKEHDDAGCNYEPFCACRNSGEYLRFGKDR